jgi:hypothetical protein
MTNDTTSSAHTPAPWRVEDIRNDYSGNTVARIGMLRIVTDNSKEDNEEANAALIASAPELLEACNEALSHACGLRDKTDESKMNLVVILKNAVAKAQRGFPDL